MTIKVPLAIAASNLEAICNAIDDEELNGVIAKILADEALLDLRSATDRRILFLDLSAGRVETLKKIRTELSAAINRLENAVDRVKEGTKGIMEAHPDLNFKGDFGTLKVHRNSTAKVSLPEIITAEVTVRNIVDPQDIKKHQIDERFYETTSFYTLLISEIKTALENNESIPWAKIERGKHLRIHR